jgi:hypothetical protein
LVEALETLVDPVTRGDPESPLRWTSKSTRELADALAGQGYRVSHTTVGQLLRAAGYSLQAAAKTREETQHPDRDAQFRYLTGQVNAYIAAGDPVVSVDTKKKELVGNYKNAGREWQPKGEPVEVDVHDFPDPAVGKAIPYGVYDVGANTGWVSVGRDHRVRRGHAAVVVATHRAALLPPRRAPADLRGLRRLQRLPAAPVKSRAGQARGPGRRGDHRVPPAARHQQVEQDRASHVLPHLDELARPSAGKPRSRRATHRRDHHPHRPTVHAELDERAYPKGIKITDKQMAALPLDEHDFHPNWNYTLQPEMTTL